jgi:uncharacterized protein YbbK (DUF523 family)
MKFSAKLKIGVSSCLLGERVRFDGAHKYNQIVADFLDHRFEGVPVCPEVELGMGIPREPVHLVAGKVLRMVGNESGKDWTDAMVGFTSKKLMDLTEQGLSGFIFKSRSPSCATGGIPVSSETGQVEQSAGLFAQAFMKHFPLTPVIDEDALQDEKTREIFIARVNEVAGLRLKETGEN